MLRCSLPSNACTTWRILSAGGRIAAASVSFRWKIVAVQGEGATSLDVQITWSDGRTERIIGFESEAAARDWILAQSRDRKHR